MDAHGIISQLQGDAALRAQLRAVLLGDEMLEVPAVVRELAAGVGALAEAQTRTESRLEDLVGRVAQLAEAQTRTESRLEDLVGRVAQLAEAQTRTESRLEDLVGRVAQLAEAQTRTESRLEDLVGRVAQLAEAQTRTESRLEDLVGRVAQLAEAQTRTESRLEDLVGRVAQLAEAQTRTESRLEDLVGRVAQLAEAQTRTESRLEDLVGRVEQLAAAQLRSNAELSRLSEWSDVFDRQLADLKGSNLQLRLERMPRRYVSRQLAKAVRLLDEARLDALLDVLDPALVAEVELADAFIEGRNASGEPILFVTEISWKAHSDDVHRAARRAEVLRRAAPEAVPLVVSQADPGEPVVAVARALGVTLVSESGGVLVGAADAA